MPGSHGNPARTCRALGTRLFVFGGYEVLPDGTLVNFGDAWVMYRSHWKRLCDLPLPVRWSVAPLSSTREGPKW